MQSHNFKIDTSEKKLQSTALLVTTHFSYSYSNADTNVAYCSFIPVNLL